MPDQNAVEQWLEPRTLIALMGVTVGASGFLFGLLSHRWTRRESRLDALGKITQPLVRCAQFLLKANGTRRKCETLKHSFSNPEHAPEAVERVNAMIDEYGEFLKSSELEFRNAESEFAAHHFRFPDGIARSVKTVQETLSELGRLVNAGLVDKADLQLAKFRDEYKRITDKARGWRLADPFEGIRKWFRRKTPAPQRASEFELTDLEMEGILELLDKRVTTQVYNSFAIHPPKVIIDEPAVLTADNVIERLKDSIFSVVFQDGTSKMLSLPELMAFIFNLINYSVTTSELAAMVQAAKPHEDRTYKVTFRFSMQEIMQPEMVKVLFQKITFADTPSDV